MLKKSHLKNCIACHQCTPWSLDVTWPSFAPFHLKELESVKPPRIFVVEQRLKKKHLPGSISGPGHQGVLVAVPSWNVRSSVPSRDLAAVILGAMDWHFKCWRLSIGECGLEMLRESNWFLNISKPRNHEITKSTNLWGKVHFKPQQGSSLPR
jgi:hypothetical protein